MKLTLTALATVIGLAALADRYDTPTALPTSLDQPTAIEDPIRISSRGWHCDMSPEWCAPDEPSPQPEPEPEKPRSPWPIRLADGDHPDWRCNINPEAPHCIKEPTPEPAPEPEKPRSPWPIRLA